MNSVLLQVAGTLAIVAALGHGYLGDKTLAALPIEPPELKAFVRLCYQFGSLGWIAGGTLLFMLPSMVRQEFQIWIALPLAVVYAFGAGVNAWYTKGRHPGWIMLTIIVGLTVMGVMI